MKLGSTDLVPGLVVPCIEIRQLLTAANLYWIYNLVPGAWKCSQDVVIENVVIICSQIR